MKFQYAHTCNVNTIQEHYNSSHGITTINVYTHYILQFMYNNGL